MTVAMLLRNSERKAYRRCRHRWAWQYIDGLIPLQDKQALAFGTLIHAALEEWYVPGLKRGVHPAETFTALYDALNRDLVQWDEDDTKYDARDLGIAMLERYVERWGTDDHLEVIDTERAFRMPIKLRGQRKRIATFVGRFDLVFRNHEDGRLWLSDHKTAKSIKVDHLELDDQAGGYLLAATPVLRTEGLLGRNEEVAGILYNYLRKAMPDSRPQDEHGRFLNKPSKDALFQACADHGLIVNRKWTMDVLTAELEKVGVNVALLGEVSKVQPPPYFLRLPVYRSDADNREQMRRLRKEAYEIGLVRAGELPIYKNPTLDCSWDCPFFEMCVMHETGVDWEEYRDEAFQVIDPYDPEYHAGPLAADVVA